MKSNWGREEEVDETEKKYIEDKFDEMRKTGRIGSLLSNTAKEYNPTIVTPKSKAGGQISSNKNEPMILASSGAATPK